MDIAVADASPLGRYLAELDGATCARSLTDLLQNEQLQPPVTSIAGKEQHPGASVTAISPVRQRRRRLSVFHRLHAMRAHTERFAAHWLGDSLTLLDEYTLREELEELPDCEQRVRRSWWFLGCSSPGASSVDLKSPVMSVVVAVSVAVYASACSLSSASQVALYAAALVVVGVFTSELVYQLMLLCHWRKARQVAAAVRGYAAAKEAFETSYQQSLDLVKKAELASRGYRIGAMLPPVGRIEKATSMKCTQLRLGLRQINDDMEQASRKLKNREHVVGTVSTATGDQKGRKRRLLRGVEQDDSVESQRAPSLLISALTKRHELANVLLDGALHSSLFDAVSLYWDLPCDGEDDDDSQKIGNRPRESQLVAFESLVLQYQELTEMLSEWNRVLDQMNNSRCLKFLYSIDVDVSDKTGDGDRFGHESSAITEEKDDGIEDLSERLKELRTACETLKHLVFTAQHDVVSAAQPSSSQQLSQSLDGTRGLMKNMVQSVNDAWAQYETALDALGGAEAPHTSNSSADLDGEDITAGDHDANAAEARQRESEKARLREDQERKKFTFVFTGTSTGEKDFDLQAILKEQQQQKVPAPTFVRELQDVLAHRETNAQPVITKQIDHDKPVAVATDVAPPEFADTKSQSSALGKPSLSLGSGGGVLQSELQSLLLLQRVRAASEEFFD